MKTPDEIKKWLECCTHVTCNGCPYDEDGCATSQQIIDALEYIQQLERKIGELTGKVAQLEAAQPKWISVEEQMPEHGTDVLVLTAPGTLSLGKNCVVAEYIHPRMEKSGVFINFYAGYDDKNILAVTHWMPLPELPKEDENEAE